MRVMRQQQPPGGKIFLIDGQGSDGRATPKNAAYGCTKAALVQLKVDHNSSLQGTHVVCNGQQSPIASSKSSLLVVGTNTSFLPEIHPCWAVTMSG